MHWSDHRAFAVTLAILGGCGHDPAGGLPDAPAADDARAGDPRDATSGVDADPGGADSAAGDGPGGAVDGSVTGGGDAAMPDAPCWSCGLPTGMVSSTVTLKQADCLIHFVTGPEYAIADSLYVVLKGTSPDALAVDVQLHIADAFVCGSPVAADGSFRCTRNTIYNSARAIGQITGTTFAVDWYWQEDDYWLKCPTMVGTLQ